MTPGATTITTLPFKFQSYKEAYEFICSMQIPPGKVKGITYFYVHEIKKIEKKVN
jgi:hypothetical protein